MSTKAKSTTLAVGTLTFVGMTCALVASIRNIPDIAATGWQMFFFMLIATVLFALPVTLIAGEFAGMMPRNGGPELWVTTGIGERWGFVTSWLLWVQMFPGMVMVASVLAPMLGTTFNNDALGLNNIFTLVCILVVYWIISILNLFFDMAKIGGQIGIWLGLYIPIVVMFALGIGAIAVTGIKAESTLGTFAWGKLIPDFTDGATLQFFLAIIFIYTGIEMSSVYITRLRNAVKTYLKGIFIALIFVFLFNVVLAFLVANIVPEGKMELNNIAQAVVLFLEVLGWPTWIANVFAALVFIGVAVQLSAWASGPAKTITNSARRGLYPPKLGYWKSNKYGVSRNVILTQATIISLFTLLYVVVPGVNDAFLVLVTATSILYIIVYVLMAIAIIRLRKTQAATARPFRIGGGKSNTLLWIVVVVLLLTIAVGSFLTLLPDRVLKPVPLSGITVVLGFGIPLWIFAARKAAWKTTVDAALAAHPESAADAASEADAGDSAPAPVPAPAAAAASADAGSKVPVSVGAPGADAGDAAATGTEAAPAPAPASPPASGGDSNGPTSG